MKRRGIQEWMRGHGALVRAFAHRTAIVEHGDRLLTPREPGAPTPPPMPPLYRARAALLAPPRAAGDELPPPQSLGDLGGDDDVFANALALGVPRAPEGTPVEGEAPSESLESPASFDSRTPDEGRPHELGVAPALRAADAPPQPTSPPVASVASREVPLFVPPRAPLPPNSLPGGAGGDSERAASSMESGGEKLSDAPLAASPEQVAGADALAPFAALAATAGDSAPVAPEEGEVSRGMEAGASGRGGDASLPAVELGNTPAPASDVAGAGDAGIRGVAGSEGAQDSLGEQSPSIRSAPAGEGASSGTAGVAPQEIAAKVARESAGTMEGSASGPAGTPPSPPSVEHVPGGNPPAPPAASLSSGSSSALADETQVGASEKGESSVLDPYVANILAVLRGEGRPSPSPSDAPSDAPAPRVADEGGHALGRDREPAVGAGGEGRPAGAPQTPNESSSSSSAAAEVSASVPAAATGPGAAAPAVPVAAASKERDLKEGMSASVTLDAASRVGEDVAPSESRMAPSADVSSPLTEGVSLNSFDAESSAAEGTSRDADRSPGSPEIGREASILDGSTGQGAAEASAARETERVQHPDVVDARREARDADEELLRRTGDPVRDAAVREVRRARPLPPELARRLAESRSSGEANPSASRAPEIPASAPIETPNENELASEPTPINPMLWLERLREAAKIEAAGGREKYREAQARAASESPLSPSAPTGATLGTPSASTSSASAVSRSTPPPSGARRVGGEAMRSTAAGTTAPSLSGAALPGAPAPSVAAASRGRSFVPPFTASPTPPGEPASNRASSSDTKEATPRLDDDLAQAIDGTPAASLGEPARTFLRPLVGIDPASVPVHEGADAGAAADARNADALAVGEHILAPPATTTGDSPESLGLLAHELTHVARQRTPSFVPPLLREGVPLPGATGATTNQPFAPPSASAGEEEIALATERAVRQTVRDAQRGSSELGAVAQTFPSAPVWNAGEEPPVSRYGFGGATDGESFGGFPAPHEPLALPSSWQRGAAPGGAATETRHRGESRGESFGLGGESSLGSTSSPAVQTAPTGRSLEHEESHASHDGDKKSGGQEDGEQIDRLAAQVYQVLRRRLLAERRRGS